ncbi:MAG: transporter [Actinomycetia bacterium]|nr:transporter [Actinomycetes bacterium]
MASTAVSPTPTVEPAVPDFAHRRLILTAMCLALVMVVAGVSMLATSLPGLAADLGASQSSQQWIVDAYALTLAALLLPAGALGDRYGRRGALIAGVALFGGAAGLAANATSPGQLIALRAAMGIGAALLMPGTLSTITSVFPEEERAKAVGIWAGFATGGGTLGILASGALLEKFYWGSIFLVTAAIALVTLVAIIVVVPSTKSTEPVRFDPLGSLTSAIGIGLLVFGIIEGPDRGWSDPVTLIGLAAGALFIVGFVLVELRAKAPLLDPRLFAHHGFATGSASLFLQFFAMFAFFFVSLQYLQIVRGYGTLAAAVALLPMTVLIMPVAAVSGTLSERYGHRLVGGAGLAVSAVGFGAFATLRPDSNFGLFLIATLIIGAGAALAMTPATNAIIASLPRSKQGVASAVNDSARELGAAFGVAVLGSVFNVGYRHSIDAHLGGLPTGVANQAREAPAIAVRIAGHVPNGSALTTAAHDAFAAGMRDSVLFGMGLLLLGAFFVWVRGASRVEEVFEDELDTDLITERVA